MSQRGRVKCACGDLHSHGTLGGGRGPWGRGPGKAVLLRTGVECQEGRFSLKSLLSGEGDSRAGGREVTHTTLPGAAGTEQGIRPEPGAFWGCRPRTRG